MIAVRYLLEPVDVSASSAFEPHLPDFDSADPSLGNRFPKRLPTSETKTKPEEIPSDGTNKNIGKGLIETLGQEREIIGVSKRK
ncbi:unnamed protein product [Brassica napus]|uniref:(rape) hypothetical protein n=1 Tax=Brassica napus TaxID=3708 RepID=A0A816PPH6_BRANA|nr:unnamed protein product [Brassica napus]